MAPSKVILQINPLDDVAVALRPLTHGQQVEGIFAMSDIPAGHKIALHAIRKGEPVLKYGYPIGVAAIDIAAGELVTRTTCRAH